MSSRWLAVIGLVAFGVIARADGAGDNQPGNVRRMPPAGIEVPAADRAELESSITALGAQIESLRSDLKSKRDLEALLPDVEIYYKAARVALQYNEFYSRGEINAAKAMLKQGMDRAAELKSGKASWATATGLVARGYISKIDGSVQPYGLVVPADFQPNNGHKYRLDLWYHGRGENLTELSFINDRQHNMGDFTPANTIVLHLYGRYCNANRFAGETDTFEALDSVKSRYHIDDNRIAVRGFSMGGAACWSFATHFGGLWACAEPGAGFTETQDFLQLSQNTTEKPSWYEQKLWAMYDSIDYANNLYNLPVVAYSGELDGQRQAAEMMTKAMAAEGLTLTHIIGPGAHHFFEANAKKEVARRVDEIMDKGRDPVPAHVKFTTWTLKYNKQLWVVVDGLGHHWARARVDAEVKDPKSIAVTTQNVTGLTLDFPAGTHILAAGKPAVTIDGQSLGAPAFSPDHAWTAHLRQTGGHWAFVRNTAQPGLHKVHNLQGPIDDAFMESFIMVKPTGTPLNAKVGAWEAEEQAHAITHWRREFRGDARVVDDTELTDAQIADCNLVLWGDPQSNKVLARIAAKLPIRWDASGVHVGTRQFSADHNVPVMIYPNPLNPKRYVVLNSGFTFREYDYLNNARQSPKLPDYAVIDVDVPVSSRLPGGVADAGFFGEHWELLADEGNDAPK